MPALSPALKKSFAALAAVASLATASPAAWANEADCADLGLPYDQCFADLVRRSANNPSFDELKLGQIKITSLSDLIGAFSTPGLTFSSISLWAKGNEVAVDVTPADGVSFSHIAAGQYKVFATGLVTGPSLKGKVFGAYAGGFTVSPVPEPETYALLGAGLLAVALMSRRRNGG